MPVEVPKEPKRYTTVYDNFNGVDFTNDPSNVYNRRSPSGLNMLPDLDGRPYKRTGWGVVKSVGDFETVGGGSLSSNKARLHYFTYGSHDYLMIFNDLGVFWLRDDSDTLTLAQLASGSPETYSVFPPTSNPQIYPDSNRAFFFEGNGTAGFYVFIGRDLYRFGLLPTEADNAKPYFRAVTPTIPVVLTGCDASGVGTVLDAVNMLTDKRTVEYFGDGASADWALPSTAANNSVSVQILVDGKWTDIPKTDNTYPWSTDNMKVSFSGTKPPASVVGNLRITYAPSTAGSYTSATANTNVATVTNTWTAKERRTRTVTRIDVRDGHGRWKTYSTSYSTPTAWSRVSTANTYGQGVLNTPNCLLTSSLVVEADYSGSYATVTPTTSWGSYNGSVAVQLKNDSIAAGATQQETTSGWVRTNSGSVQTYNRRRTVKWTEEQTRTLYKTKTFNVKGSYTKYTVTDPDTALQRSKNAFASCTKVLDFGNNISSQVFMASSGVKEFRNRVWYSAANDVAYWPDLNYIEVGADDKPVMGMLKVGQYLGIVKTGGGTEAAIYLAYATSFDDKTTYAVKQSVAGVGAISNGAFNVLSEEPLFLSERGVMGINISETDKDKQIRNRSWFINKRLLSEDNIGDAISFVHKGLYYLALNNHCYVLDGSQKSSWANEKTNLQYECYYLDNMPVQCFGRMGDRLYFTDTKGNLCRMKEDGEAYAYVDDYDAAVDADWTSSSAPVNGEILVTALSGGHSVEFTLMDNDDEYLNHEEETPPDEEPDRLLVFAGSPAIGETVMYGSVYYTIKELGDGTAEYTETFTGDGAETDFTVKHIIGEVVTATVDGEEAEYTESGNTVSFDTAPGNGDAIVIKYTGAVVVIVENGSPVPAEWSTLADDDGMVHFFKNLTKKGCVISILPGNESGVEVYLKPDAGSEIFIGVMGIEPTYLPAEVYPRKKVKKYKRLQIICRNNAYNDAFGLDQIIKTYTVGNYSKNRRRK